MRITRQHASILLLALWLLPSTFLLGYLRYQRELRREAVKHELLKGVDAEKLLRLSFEKEDAQRQLHWEEDWEFEYQGQLYDVVRTQQSADSVHYWCWLDTEETALYQQIQSLLFQKSQADPRESSQKETLLSFLKQLFLSPRDMGFPAYLSTLSHSPPATHSLLPQRAHSPPTPPPRWI